jgi:hypothetical protein
MFFLRSSRLGCFGGTGNPDPAHARSKLNLGVGGFGIGSSGISGIAIYFFGDCSGEINAVVPYTCSRSYIV